MHFVIQIIFGLLLADFMIAFFHWFEDTYFSYCMKIPIISTIAKENEMHHYFPRDIVSYSYLENMSVTFPLSILILIIIFAIFPSFVLKYKFVFITFCLIGSIANIFHRYSHMRDCECPPCILFLHRIGILVGQEHHKKHHENPEYRYGVVFQFTNFLYDNVGFWRAMEYIIYLLFGLKASTKPPYKDYVENVKYTEHHNESKQKCPRVVSIDEINYLKQNLDTYYSCPLL